MTSVLLFTDPEKSNQFFLGEVEAGEDDATTPLRIYGTNVTKYILRNVTISAEGNGSDQIELSLDRSEWTSDPLLVAELLVPEEEFIFYSRAVSPDEDADPGVRRSELVVRSTSIERA